MAVRSIQVNPSDDTLRGIDPEMPEIDLPSLEENYETSDE
jgi:hypothetical protein